ncbi:MAG: hypothetical protein WBL91_09085 [Pseudolabrys sp.]
MIERGVLSRTVKLQFREKHNDNFQMCAAIGSAIKQFMGRLLATNQSHLY